MTVDQMSTEKLLEILNAPRPMPEPVGASRYDGPPDIKPFIDQTILKQANRCNSVFRFAIDANGTLKQLNLDDLVYSATTMLGTFKFSFITKPDYRFAVVFSGARFESFLDTRFASDVFDRNAVKYEALHRATNHVTKEQAVVLVREALGKLGYDQTSLKRFGEPYVRQLAFTSGGKQYPLPYYFIDFVDPESENEPKSAPLRAEVLGIEPGGRITHFSDYFWHVPTIGLPEGYREKVEAYWRSTGKPPPRQ